jgi:DNA-binding response OmpR family regulator
MSATPKNVLVLDSQLLESERLSWELPHDQYNVTFTSDLNQAFDLIGQCDYDLALIEVDFPRRKTLGLLRTLHKAKPNTKIVMLTDYGDDELWVDVVNQGASDLLTRPVCLRDLEQQL